MILLNFSHPLTAEHLAAITALSNETDIAVRDIPTHFDILQPFVPQITALADACDLSATEWQTAMILINPPALSTIAASLLAELHGRMGYFAPIVRLRPMNIALPRFEVAEILQLQALRDNARARRGT